MATWIFNNADSDLDPGNPDNYKDALGNQCSSFASGDILQALNGAGLQGNTDPGVPVILQCNNPEGGTFSVNFSVQIVAGAGQTNFGAAVMNGTVDFHDSITGAGGTSMDGTLNGAVTVDAGKTVIGTGSVAANVAIGAAGALRLTGAVTGNVTLADGAGISSSALTGNVIAPDGTTVPVGGIAVAITAGSPSYTAASNVRSGTDRGDGTTGTLLVPTAANVLFGVAVDASTGLAHMPAASDVRRGVAVNQTTGTLSAGNGNIGGGISF